MRDSLKRIFVLTKRNLKEIVRDPISLIFMFGLPLFLEILFYLIFHELTPQFEMKYLAPSVVVFSQSFLTIFVGLLLSIDRNTSFLTRLYVSKAKSHEFIFSYSLALIPFVLVQSILFFLIGGIFDSSIFSINMLYAILLSIVTSLFYIAIGILIGATCSEKAVGGVASIIINAQSILSGMWFPIDKLNGGILYLMDVLPFRNGVLLVQNVLNGFNDTFNDFTKPLLIILAYTIVSIVLAIIFFGKKMKTK